MRISGRPSNKMLAIFPHQRYTGICKNIMNLQGGVKFSTGGIVREP